MLPVKDIQKVDRLHSRRLLANRDEKKLYPTFIDESAAELSSIVVSGGKIGMQIELSVADLQTVAEAVMHDVRKTV
ncbi:hypothetical protein GCM10020331_015520 [Ectobacillus funiculus]